MRKNNPNQIHSEPGTVKKRLNNAKTYRPGYIKSQAQQGLDLYNQQADQEKAMTKIQAFNRERRSKVFKYFGYAGLIFIIVWLWSLF